MTALLEANQDLSEENVAEELGLLPTATRCDAALSIINAEPTLLAGMQIPQAGLSRNTFLGLGSRVVDFCALSYEVCQPLTVAPHSYQCTCTFGWSGENCFDNIQECDSNPCANGGECVDDVADYACNCLPGYSGDNCEVDIDECAVAPCLNGGECANLENAFSCTCADGWEFGGENSLLIYLCLVAKPKDRPTASTSVQSTAMSAHQLHVITAVGVSTLCSSTFVSVQRAGQARIARRMWMTVHRSRACMVENA